MSKKVAVEEEIDFLEEDDPIRGQEVVLLSFLSPEKVLQDKSRYFFNEFLKDYEVSWKTKNLEKYLAETILGIRKTLFDEADRLESEDLSGAAQKCKDAAKAFSIEGVLDTYKAFLDKNKREIGVTKINADFDDFLFKNGDKLEDEFYKMNKFHTSIRGLKVRGVYGSRGEAELRAKKLQQKDKRHDILIGEVGKWLAWDPSPHQIPSQEYANDQLNTLMKAYNANEDAREMFYKENPQAKGAKNVKSVFNMSLEPTEVPAGVGPKENVVVGGGDAAATATTVTEATKTLFDGPADLALARKMENATVAATVSVEEKKD
jgi:hypothetical protein